MRLGGVREDDARLGILVRGETQFGEPGVFMMFEENAAAGKDAK